MRLIRFAALLLITAGLMAWPVFADTVSIGLSTGGPITTVASGPGTAAFTGPFGSFSSVSVSGHGASVLTPPDVLFANSIETATATGGTLTIWVTDQGLASPTGLLPFTSSFTANLVPAGWTVDEDTFVSPTNALFSGVPLGAATFAAIGTNVQTQVSATGSSLFSVSEEFLITARGAGDGNLTVDLSAVPTPEPGSLVIVGLGLLGVAVIVRRHGPGL